MIGRLLVGVGIFLSGYYFGKQMGLTEKIRKDLAAKRNQNQLTDEPPDSTVEKVKSARTKKRQAT